MLSVELHAIIEVSGAIEIVLDDVIRIRGEDDSIVNANLDGRFRCCAIILFKDQVPTSLARFRKQDSKESVTV